MTQGDQDTEPLQRLSTGHHKLSSLIEGILPVNGVGVESVNGLLTDQ